MPERAVRFGIANHDRSRKAATWRCWTNLGRDNSVYLTCRELQGSLHLSLHGSGRWHVAFAREKFEKLFEETSHPESRFACQWLKPPETAPGLVLACRIHTPWYAVTSSNLEGSKDIVWIDAPPQASMSEVCVFLAAPGTICTNWPGSRAMHTALVGSFDLADNARVWIVSRNIPLAEPVLPPTANPRFFKGADEQSLSVETLRAVVWGNADDGSVGFFESPVRVQRNNS